MAKQRQWYQIQAKDDSTAEILIYEQIGQDFWGDGVSAKRFVEDLHALDVEKIILRINSPGGNVFDGNSIYNTLKAHKATIEVVIDGIAASIASVIAMAGDTIEMPENAMMMIHDPANIVWGTAEDMIKMADVLEKVKTGIVAAYHNKSNLDNEQLAEMMTDETWLTAQEALDYGLATVVTDQVNIQDSLPDLSMYKKVPPTLTASNKGTTTNKEDKSMTKDGTVKLTDITLDFIKDKFPAIVTAISDEVKSLFRKDGAKEERERIKAVQDQLISGHEELITTLMWDGETTGEQAAVQVLQAEKAIQAKIAGDIQDDALDAIEQPDGDGDQGDQGDSNLPLKDQCKAKWDKDKDLRAEFGDDFDAYLAYETATNQGRVKVLNKG